MAAKKDLNGAMPMTPETDTTPSAKITYANEVVAIIAGLAAAIIVNCLILLYRTSNSARTLLLQSMMLRTPIASMITRRPVFANGVRDFSESVQQQSDG